MAAETRKSINLPYEDGRYRELVENLQEGIWELDLDFNTVFVNPRMAEMLGYSIEEMIGENTYSFVDGPNLKRARRYLKRQSQGIREQFDFEFIKKDGTILHTRMEAGPVYDKDKKIKGVFASLMDISRRKKAEEDLKKSRRNFSLAFQASPAPTVISTLNEGRFIDVNKSWLDLIGYDRSEMIGRTAQELKIWDNDSRRGELVAKLKKERAVKNELVNLRTKKGKIKHILWSAEVIEMDGEEAMLSMSYDISAQKGEEEVLREFSVYVRSLIEASIDPLLSISPERRITDVNKATEDFLGITRESLIGTDFAQYFANPQQAEMLHNQVLLNDFVKNCPLQMRHKSGKSSDVLLNASIYRDSSGNVQGIFAAARDMEDQKKVLKALEKRDRELSLKSKNLQELNAALKVLLKHREYDKKELESKVLMNVKKLIMPCVEKLKGISSEPEQKAYLDILETHLQDIISPFLHTLTAKHLGLTPREIEVVTMIREDKSTKEISNALNISTRAVEFHRNSIRKKFQLSGKKVNLKSYLTRLG